MKDNIRSITATALLLLGFSKASASVEGATMSKAHNPEPFSGYCIPCNCTE
jgi:hypothetical protein